MFQDLTSVPLGLALGLVGLTSYGHLIILNLDHHGGRISKDYDSDYMR